MGPPARADGVYNPVQPDVFREPWALQGQDEKQMMGRVVDLEPDSFSEGRGKDKRRLQNRVAQRASRAKARVRSTEMTARMEHLEQLTESQGQAMEKMSELVTRLESENIELRRVGSGGSRGQEQLDVDVAGEKSLEKHSSTSPAD